jgi:RNA polymerase sigma-70 factor (ECF subfamily)
MAQGLTEQDDGVLALRASEGDGPAFGEIVRRYQAQVFRLCRRYVGGADAEDIAQEAFVKAFLNVKRFDASRPMSPWLLTIARRLCIDRLRQRKARPASDEEPEALPTAATAEADTASKETLGQLQGALKELPEGQREAVLLFHVEELAYKEIAAVLDVPMGTVMTWLHRARAQLRQKLGDEHPAAKKLSMGVET